MNQDEIDNVLWLQEDARYLYAQADHYRSRAQGSDLWVAAEIQQAAACSAKCARVALGVE